MQNAKYPALVGVVHLPALPGAPRSSHNSMTGLVRAAVREAQLLDKAGFEALILENFGDVPFFKNKVPAITISAMTVIASAVRDQTRLPIGINVLRNDAHAALAIATVTGCQFIRVNVLSGVAATDQGIIEGDAANLMRERANYQGSDAPVQIWADALVKHARTLSTSDSELALEEVAMRSMADAVILTGSTTGRVIDIERVKAAVEMELPVPLYLGSGVTPENISELAPLAHGVIVGSALREGGKAGASLDKARVRKFLRSWLRARRR